jgi:thiol-disulfide isomerase/thioredoxin
MNQWTVFKYVLPVTALLALLYVAGCTNSNDRQSDTRIGVEELQMQGQQMPSFNLPSPLSGDTAVSSGSLEGKVLLVSFFASWCRSCLEEIPLLKKMQDRYDDQEFSIITIAVDRENEQGLKNLIQKQKINYPVLLADEAVKKDFGGIAILPTMFLVSREGILLKKYSGHIERSSLIRDIEQTLNL